MSVDRFFRVPLQFFKLTGGGTPQYTLLFNNGMNNTLNSFPMPGIVLWSNTVETSVFTAPATGSYLFQLQMKSLNGPVDYWNLQDPANSIDLVTINVTQQTPANITYSSMLYLIAGQQVSVGSTSTNPTSATLDLDSSSYFRVYSTS